MPELEADDEVGFPLADQPEDSELYVDFIQALLSLADIPAVDQTINEVTKEVHGDPEVVKLLIYGRKTVSGGSKVAKNRAEFEKECSLSAMAALERYEGVWRVSQSAYNYTHESDAGAFLYVIERTDVVADDDLGEFVDEIEDDE